MSLKRQECGLGGMLKPAEAPSHYRSLAKAAQPPHNPEGNAGTTAAVSNKVASIRDRSFIGNLIHYKY